MACEARLACATRGPPGGGRKAIDRIAGEVDQSAPESGKRCEEVALPAELRKRLKEAAAHGVEESRIAGVELAPGRGPRLPD